MKHRIFHLGEKELRQVADPISQIDDDIRTLVADMFETMRAANGVGLAATQLGINKRLFVIELEQQPLVFINPKIIRTAGKETAGEGCLSLPGLREDVQRAGLVVAQATDLEGNTFKITGEGLLARAIQHELDHLEGVLFIDRISKARRLQIRRELALLEAGETLQDEDEEDDVKDEDEQKSI